MVWVDPAGRLGWSAGVPAGGLPGRFEVHVVYVDQAGRGPVERSQGSYFLGHPGDLVGQADALGGAGPHELEPPRLDAEGLDRALQQLEAAQGLVVLLDVVAFAGMAAAHENRVGAFGEGLEHERGIQPTRAHQPDQPNVGLVLGPSRAGQVRGPVAAPVAGEADDDRLEGGGRSHSLDWSRCDRCLRAHARTASSISGDRPCPSPW